MPMSPPPGSLPGPALLFPLAHGPTLLPITAYFSTICSLGERSFRVLAPITVPGIQRCLWGQGDGLGSCMKAGSRLPRDQPPAWSPGQPWAGNNWINRGRGRWASCHPSLPSSLLGLCKACLLPFPFPQTSLPDQGLRCAEPSLPL